MCPGNRGTRGGCHRSSFRELEFARAFSTPIWDMVLRPERRFRIEFGAGHGKRERLQSFQATGNRSSASEARFRRQNAARSSRCLMSARFRPRTIISMIVHRKSDRAEPRQAGGDRANESALREQFCSIGRPTDRPPKSTSSTYQRRHRSRKRRSVRRRERPVRGSRSDERWSARFFFFHWRVRFAAVRQNGIILRMFR